jgi:pyridoxamine 5'-phosphate oxidase
MATIADIRKDYKLQSLHENEVAANPTDQFTAWWNEAISSNIDEVNAMTLATASTAGKPDARIVLLKGFDENGFVFFTNYQSRKAQELAANSFATLVFFWKELERQVRIEGTVEKIAAADSDAYFNSRPVGSRIGAWASPQSTVINDRTLLEENVKQLEVKYADGNIPRPEHWGGYVVKPTQVEFWQGRSSRLHDRIRYELKNDKWIIERLAP